jgi:thiol-disulfide isomerase/thioredoxin
MKKNQWKFFGLTLSCMLMMNLQAQKTNYPEIGKRCPDFSLTDVSYFSKQQVSLNDFKGKYLILDFWDRTCIACIQSFPETNKLQEEFKDKIQFLLVGTSGPLIKPLYERFREKFDLHLAAAYDSTLYRRFGVESYPHAVWINEKGIVVGITTNTQVNEKNIRIFLQGKDPGLTEKNDIRKNDPKAVTQKRINGFKPLLLNGNGGDDTTFLYRSVLAGWKKEYRQFTAQTFFWTFPRNNFLVVNVGLNMLYKMAYGDTMECTPVPGLKNSYGQYWTRLLLEITDSSLFEADYATGKNIFCYNLIVPPANADKLWMQQIMQRDLQNYFRYEVKLENRMMPCWNLVATNEAREKLKTKGAPTAEKGYFLTGFELINRPVSRLIYSLWAMNQTGPPFFDETGISGNIDLKMEKGSFDFNDALKELRKNGLDLVKGEKEMKVIVVRNPQH